MITAGDIRFSDRWDEITSSETVRGSLELAMRLYYIESECIDARRMCVDKINREINRKIYGDVVRDLVALNREVHRAFANSGLPCIGAAEPLDKKFSELIAKLEWRDQ